MSKKVLTEKEELELLDGLDKIIGDKEDGKEIGINEEEFSEEEGEELLILLKEYSSEVLDNMSNYHIHGTLDNQGIVVPIEDFDKILAVLKAVQLA